MLSPKYIEEIIRNSVRSLSMPTSEFSFIHMTNTDNGHNKFYTICGDHNGSNAIVFYGSLDKVNSCQTKVYEYLIAHDPIIVSNLIKKKLAKGYVKSNLYYGLVKNVKPLTSEPFTILQNELLKTYNSKITIVKTQQMPQYEPVIENKYDERIHSFLDIFD